ncbi:MAG: T9SS type A sorting domain-containing protein [Candidatus Cloacimonetes bacterium]|nr:T9SS type A sorting domain-containing protein [Candidatus Cloacimonadota bacterium]
MKKTITCLFIIFVGILFANPIIIGPKIVELYRDGDDWQITLYNEMMEEFTLDNCALSTNYGFTEFNDGIEFFETVTVTYEDLQDSLYIDWESDVIQTYFDEGSGFDEVDSWSFAPITYWFNSVNPLYSGQALHDYEPMMDYEFLVKYSDLPGSLGMYGFLEGNVYDVNENPVENASIEFYRSESGLENIFIPAVTDEQGFFNTQIYAKNYEVSACINGIVYVDTFLTIEPDSTTFVEFYTDYNSSSSNNHEISLPSSYYNLTNYPNPFNPSTEISFSVLQTSSSVTIEIFNSRGQKLKVLPVILSGVEGRGEMKYRVVWDGTNENNKQVPSGVYLYKLVSNGKELAVSKMLLLK